MVRLKENQVFDDKYLIVKELGEGGMGIVYLASQIDAQRKVAIKVLREGTFGAGDSERFLRECKILASLKHLNIASIFSLALIGPIKYAVCEYVDGADLAKIINSCGALDWKRATHTDPTLQHPSEYATTDYHLRAFRAQEYLKSNSTEVDFEQVRQILDPPSENSKDSKAAGLASPTNEDLPAKH